MLQCPVQWDAKGRPGANPIKAGHGADCRLQPACMKRESLVIAGQLHRGEYVLGACTHRPSRQPSGRHLKSSEEGAEGVFHERGEVVTR
jgi:hypothetical protein